MHLQTIVIGKCVLYCYMQYSFMTELEKIYPEDLKLFPDLEKFINDLEILDNYDFNNLNEKEIYDIYYDYARVLPTNIGWFKPEKFNSLKFYRVRLNIDPNKEDITLAQTYSYPPPKFCFENGRANLKGKSVFYCSNEAKVAVLECKPKEGDEGFLTEWKGTAKRPIKIGQLLPFDLPDENVWNLMAKDSYEFLKTDLPENAKDKFKHFLTLYRFIAHKFITEKKPYSLTSMISWELLYGQLWRDFILYPSVQLEGTSCNMAFHPNSVNENLQFNKLIKFKVVGFENESPIFNLGKVGIIDNTKMIWRDRTDEETNLFKKQSR